MRSRTSGLRLTGSPGRPLVTEERTARVWESISACARWERAPISVRHACIACSQAMAAIGAGLSMTRGDGLRDPVYATDPRSQELEELQFGLGEGPGVEARRGERPVLVCDMGSAEAARRWPVFAPATAGRGVKAMLAIPVGAGAVRLGVLDLYFLHRGMPAGPKLAEALTFADAALVLALDQFGGVDPGLAEMIATGFAERQAEVHQAAGMVAAQIGAGVTEALARLRAHAYANGRRLAEVAEDVVARRLRFGPAQDDWSARDADLERRILAG